MTNKKINVIGATKNVAIPVDLYWRTKQAAATYMTSQRKFIVEALEAFMDKKNDSA